MKNSKTVYFRQNLLEHSKFVQLDRNTGTKNMERLEDT